MCLNFIYLWSSVIVSGFPILTAADLVVATPIHIELKKRNFIEFTFSQAWLK